MQYGPRSVAVAGKPAPPPAKRGPATIVLQDGYELPATYETARPAGAMRPTTLASTDFDIDGYPDLVRGYATPNGGYLVFQRGNPESFAPTRPENVEAAGQSRFHVAFLPTVKTVELAAAPDFIVTGDFDRDTNPDVIAAARGGQEIYLAAGDGDGGFTAARSIALPGRVTALAAGQVDLMDGMTDLAVGLEGENGAALLVYNNAKGVADAPFRYALPAAAQALALGELDDTVWADVAILAGGQLYILHGRNHREGRESAKRAAARLESVPLSFAAQALALGQFIWDRDLRTEIALLREDGTVAFAARGALDTKPFTVEEIRERRRRQLFVRGDDEAFLRPPANWRADAAKPWAIAESLSVMEAAHTRPAANTPLLFSSQLSGAQTDDLLVLDAAAQQFKVFAVEAPPQVDGEFVSFAGPRAQMSLPVAGAPVAALSMRVNMMPRPGLVFLRAGGDAPEVIPSAPTATFDVDRTDDTNAAAAQVCSAAANDCSLRGAISKANGAAGMDTINIPANTYTLGIANAGGANEDANTTGDLDVTGDTALNGAAAATTIIQAGTTSSNGIDKVMGFNPVCGGNANLTLQNLTLRFGRNTQTFGLADAGYLNSGFNWCNSGNSVASISNSVFTANTNVTGEGGGIGIIPVTGDTSTVTLTNVTSSNNINQRAAGVAHGAGLEVGADKANVNLNNCQITGNQITGSGVGGGIHVGGAIAQTSQVMIHGTTISGNTTTLIGGGVNYSGLVTASLTIDQDSVIDGNTSQGTSGNAEGGGIYSNIGLTATLTVNEVTITNNVSSAASANPRGGGGIGFGPGNATVSFCRFFGNTAGGGAGFGGTAMHKDLNPGVITATNNWFGCNGGPNTAGCQTTVVGGGGTPGSPAAAINTNPWLILRHSASPATIVTGQTSTLTADFLQNSAAGSVAVANLDALIGTPITFSGAALGALSAAQTTIQSPGTATATFTANAAGAGSADAVVDGQTTTASITINKASTTASVGTDTPDPSNVGQNVTVTYSVAVTSPGGGTPGGNVMVSDGVNSCTGTVAAGSCLVALSTAGNRNLTATYQGDANYNASAASSSIPHVVGQVTWSGAASAAYATNGNWNTGLTPGSGDTVTIPTAGVTNNPTLSGAASVTALTVQSGRTLTVNSTLTVSGTLTNNGTIMGTGTIANNFTNTGALTPGLSPGVLNITGTFANTGSVNMEIGGTGGAGVDPNGHDQLVVSGAATLGGTLNVTLTNGFTPAPLNNFLLLNASTLSGTFTTVNLPNIAPLVWNLQYVPLTGDVFLGVLGPTASGVNVGGYVLTSLGRAPRLATVKLTDINGQLRTVTVNRWGHYQFDAVEAGRTYFLTVEAKGYNFTPATAVVTPNFDVEELNFTANASPR